MRSVAEQRLAVFQVHGRFQMKLFRQRISPELALNVESEMVALHIRVDSEAARSDARFESADSLGQVLLQSVHIRRGLAAKLADAEVDDRTERLRVIPQIERLHAFNAKRRLSVKEPFEI